MDAEPWIQTADSKATHGFFIILGLNAPTLAVIQGTTIVK